MRKRLILLTNDYGVTALGLQVLFRTVKSLGEVWVVAPDREQSATSHSLTLHRPLRMNKIAEKVYSVDGTPTDAVMIAVHGLLKRKPYLVISGINHGPNLGDDVTYSGTVAAAIEGTILGIPSLAVSATKYEKKSLENAADFVRKLSKYVLEKKLPKDTFLNINFPNTKREFKEFEFTRLGKRIFRDVIVEKLDPRGKKYFWIAGEPTSWEQSKDTDFSVVERGKISITPLHLDSTNHKVLNDLKNWKLKI